MFFPQKELETVATRLAAKTGKNVDMRDLFSIVQSHPRSRKFARKLIAILAAEADEAYKSPGHEADTIGIKMALDSDDIATSEAVLQLFFPDYDYTGLGADVDPAKVNAAALELNRAGVVVLDDRLSADKVAALIDVLQSDDVTFAEKGTGTIHQGYDPVRAEQAAANTVWLVDQDKLNKTPLINQIAFDPFILSVAQAYLGAPPIHVQTNAWWSLHRADDDKALAASAQKYHQDKEFVKFIKLFVYLSDVGPENGPHEYVAGSTHDYQRAIKRRSKFGKRYDTAHIEKIFGRGRIKTMTGPAGTMILEDTHGFHRGVPVLQGHRLLLQFEYANSLFCSPVERFSGAGVAAWEDHLRRYPRLFANYD